MTKLNITDYSFCFEESTKLENTDEWILLENKIIYSVLKFRRYV